MSLKVYFRKGVLLYAGRLNMISFTVKHKQVKGKMHEVFGLISTTKVSWYDQEILHSQTADKPMAPRGRATQLSKDTRKTN